MECSLFELSFEKETVALKQCHSKDVFLFSCLKSVETILGNVKYSVFRRSGTGGDML